MTIEAFWRKRQRSMYGFFKRTRIVREQMKTSRNVDASDDPHYVTVSDEPHCVTVSPALCLH